MTFSRRTLFTGSVFLLLCGAYEAYALCISPWFAPPIDVPTGPGGSDILVVSSRNTANVESMLWFLREVMPAAGDPAVVIAGSVDAGVRAKDAALHARYAHCFRGRQTDFELAFRSESHRSAGDRSGGCLDVPGRHRGVLCAGPPRHERRSYRRFEIRINQSSLWFEEPRAIRNAGPPWDPLASPAERERNLPTGPRQRAQQKPGQT